MNLFRFRDLRHTFATRLVAGRGRHLHRSEDWTMENHLMVMRYAHHPESLHAGVMIAERVPPGVSRNLAQSASRTSAEAGAETAVSS